MIGVFVAATVIQPFGKVEHWGDPNGGRFGSVAVNAVPQHSAAESRRSCRTRSPTTPSRRFRRRRSKTKAQPKVKAPDPDAIPLKSKNAKQRESKQAAAPNKWADQQQYKPNQLYSTRGQAASSPLYNMPGGGGVGVGTNSPFGTQFGSYANLLREKVSQRVAHRRCQPDDCRARLRSWSGSRSGAMARWPPDSRRSCRSSGDAQSRPFRAARHSGRRAVPAASCPVRPK